MNITITQNALFDYMEIEELRNLGKINICLEGLQTKQLLYVLNSERKMQKMIIPKQ